MGVCEDSERLTNVEATEKLEAICDNVIDAEDDGMIDAQISAPQTPAQVDFFLWKRFCIGNIIAKGILRMDVDMMPANRKSKPEGGAIIGSLQSIRGLFAESPIRGYVLEESCCGISHWLVAREKEPVVPL